MYRIGIDLGGTNTAAALVSDSLEIVDRASVKTNLPTTILRIRESIASLVALLLERNGLTAAEILSVGIGVPCTADEKTGYMEDASHLGFDRGSLAEPLAESLHIPVRIGNDANAAALGEFVKCGYDTDSLILVTLGTGIGGGIILNGKLWSGINYAAGELGHMVIRIGGEPCCCGRRGCFEAYGSATALIGQARAAMTRERDTLLWTLCGGDPNRLEAKTVFDAAAAGDSVARESLDAYTGYLAEGLANIINIFQPGVLCIGGGVSEAGAALYEPLSEKIAPLLYTRNSTPNTQIILARLGNDAGLIGAAML